MRGGREGGIKLHVSVQNQKGESEQLYYTAMLAAMVLTANLKSSSVLKLESLFVNSGSSVSALFPCIRRTIRESANQLSSIQAPMTSQQHHDII